MTDSNNSAVGRRTPPTCSGLSVFQSLRTLMGADYVVLRHHDNDHTIKRVRWLGGTPFAAPYLPQTLGQLLPGGEFTGPSYISAWLPITPRMQAHFCQNDTANPPTANQ